ncbi:MAG: hypothetical protein COA42_10510 [Alteromonadaceae bacterium]|nr:MAG: hypothetical protein COA42_10510 [Alteromonadaceae bacterium]
MFSNTEHAKSHKSLVIATLVLYFLFLVLSRIPAVWGAWFIHSVAPQLWLTGVSGTIWEGSAKGSQIDLGPSPLALGEFKWKLKPLSILMLSPCLHFETSVSGQMASGEVCHSLVGTITLNDINIDAPVDAVSHLLPIESRGQMSLQVIEATINGNEIDALDARLSWQNARVKPDGQPWLILGAYAATLTGGDQGGINAKVLDLQGAYGIDLDAKWSPKKPLNDSVSIEGTVALKEGASDMVKQALDLIGEVLSDGVYKVQW